MVEPKVRGQEGYVAWCIELIEMGVCPCQECGGHLEGDRCLSCACRHWVQEPTNLQRQRYAVGIPVYEAGRCAEADVRRAEEARERQRQARVRATAEATGDPQR